MSSRFILVTPATRGLSLALTRHYLKTASLPVYATYRSGDPKDVKEGILQPLPQVNPDRLCLLPLDLKSEESIQGASENLQELVQGGQMHLGFFTGGVLHAERKQAEIDYKNVLESFQINVMSHLLLIKHFSKFLPERHSNKEIGNLSKWVHVSARVGSISDNKSGGWFTYRASKAALNQVIRTFDHQLRMRGAPCICVGVHPGTVKTNLSHDFWKSVPKGKLFTPDHSAECIARVVDNLSEEQRGKIWDWEGKNIPW